MIQKKICLLGAFAVGKTSLIVRYVDSLFSDKYHTTVGVKIDKKQLTVDDQDLTLMIWDLAGQDELTRVKTSYLRGVSGYIIVADVTRPHSLDIAINMHKETREFTGDVPFILALNKSDLTDKWLIDREAVEKLRQEGVTVINSSAKTGEGVEVIFEQLSHQMLESKSANTTKAAGN